MPASAAALGSRVSMDTMALSIAKAAKTTPKLCDQKAVSPVLTSMVDQINVPVVKSAGQRDRKRSAIRYNAMLHSRNEMKTITLWMAKSTEGSATENPMRFASATTGTASKTLP